MKKANAECVQSKPYWVLTLVNSNLTGDYKFEQKTFKKCLKTIHGNLSNFQLFMTEAIEHVTRLVLTYTTKTSQQNRQAPHVIIMTKASAPESVT